jgi:hypothetical protein
MDRCYKNFKSLDKRLVVKPKKNVITFRISNIKYKNTSDIEEVKKYEIYWKVNLMNPYWI